MALPNIFESSVVQGLKTRINQLISSTVSQWRTMNAPQMLAHLNVMFELALEDRQPQPNSLVSFLLKVLVKNKITRKQTYARNSRTAPEMMIIHQPDFRTEQHRLIKYFEKIDELGAAVFLGKAPPHLAL